MEQVILIFKSGNVWRPETLSGSPYEDSRLLTFLQVQKYFQKMSFQIPNMLLKVLGGTNDFLKKALIIISQSGN